MCMEPAAVPSRCFTHLPLDPEAWLLLLLLLLLLVVAAAPLPALSLRSSCSRCSVSRPPSSVRMGSVCSLQKCMHQQRGLNLYNALLHHHAHCRNVMHAWLKSRRRYSHLGGLYEPTCSTSLSHRISPQVQHLHLPVLVEDALGQGVGGGLHKDDVTRL